MMQKNSPPLSPDMTTPDWLAKTGSQLQQIYAYWRERCRDGHPPRRADIDPIDIPRLLPHLTIVEVVADARRYVYRLVGTREVEVRGNDPTGKSVADAFFGPSREDSFAWYDRAVASAEAQYDGRPYLANNGRWVSDETLFLPLSDDGVTVNKILVFATVSPARDR